MKNLESAHMFNLSVKIYVEEMKKSPNHWYYTIVETNKFGINHYKIYHSTNELALARHRKKTLENLDKRRDLINRGAYSIGIEVKPTLLEKIKMARKQKSK